MIRTEEKYKPLISSALEGMIAGILLFVLYLSMMRDGSVLAIIPFFLLMLTLPSALVLHLSSTFTLSKKFPNSWQKDKTIVSCLTSVLLIYAYTIILLLLIESGKILESGREILFFLKLPFIVFMSFHQMMFGLLPAMAVAFIATRGMGNKFARIIFALLLACLVYSTSLFPIAMTLGS